MDWIKNYNKAWLSGDLAAGLTVGVMLIPQGMAYAMLAGLPPIHGLYASTIPLVLYAFLGTSRQISVGPVAMDSLLTAAAIGALQPASMEAYIALAAILAIMVGTLQFLMGNLRLGFLVNFLSQPVISGFTSAAAIIIGLSQMKHLLGINLPKSEHVQDILVVAIPKITETHLSTFAIGIIAIVGMKLIKKYLPVVPSALVAVVLGILVVWVFGLDQQGVKILGAVPEGLPSFVLPAFDGQTIRSLLPSMLTIALIGFMESFAVAKAIQAKHKDYSVDSNRELIALGASNISAGLFQGFPVTGGLSRTAVNDQAGAKSGLSSIIAAFLIVLTLLFLTPLFHYLPNAVLAAIILVAVIGLINVDIAKSLWTHDRADFWMLLATFIITLTLGIENGILAGVLLSLGMVVFRATRPHVAVLARVPNSYFYRNVARFPDLEPREDALIVRFDGPLFFANLNFFQQTMEKLMGAKGDTLRLVVLNMDSVTHVDSSAVLVLSDWLEDTQKQGIQVFFTSVMGPVRDTFQHWGLTKKIGEHCFFMSNQQAVDAFDGTDLSMLKDDLGDYVLQANQ